MPVYRTHLFYLQLILSSLFVFRVRGDYGAGRLGSPKTLRAHDIAHTSSSSNARDLQEEETVELVYVGDEGTPPEAFPLGRCEADCDSDADCRGKLKCFQRGFNQQVDIPGCHGQLVGGRDYCYEDPDDSTGGGLHDEYMPILHIRAASTEISNNNPLGLCEGDCDYSGQCSEGLRCFQRGGLEPVPGCWGLGYVGMDYCYNDTSTEFIGSQATNSPTPLPTATPTPQPSAPPTSPPTAPPTSPPTDAPTPLPSPQPSPKPTAFPTVPPDTSSPTSGTLVFVENNPNFLLGECEGDCDHDNDCEGALKCFQRDSSTKSVPGCTGLAIGVWDYCWDDGSTLKPTDRPTESPTQAPVPPPTHPPTPQPTKTPTPQPTHMPTIQPTPEPTHPPTPSPTAAPTFQPPTPLPTSMPTPVPTNTPTTPPTTPPSASPTPIPTSPPTTSPSPSPTLEPTLSPTSDMMPLVVAGNNGGDAFPLKRCQGDCDRDSDCTGALKCFQRSAGGAGPPGCSGTPDQNKDYCYDESFPQKDEFGGQQETTDKSLILLGNNKQPSNVFPLGMCEGDCDNNAECAGSLRCFQRDDLTRVPGCAGVGVSGRDYCYNPYQTSAPTPPPTPIPTRSPTPNPTVSPTTRVPTPPTRPPTPVPTRRPTRAPTNAPTVFMPELRTVGNNGIVGRGEDAEFPLGLCQGDCDSDFECKVGLRCYQRSGEEAVPGCMGKGVPGNDYCFSPSGSLGLDMPRFFKLRLHWELGYLWQESPREMRWCLTCVGNNCKTDSKIEITFCDRTNVQWELMEPTKNTTQIKLRGRNLCLTRFNVRALRTNVCDGSSTRQQWYPGRGNWDGRRFEIKSVNKPGCVSQHHHPKDKEPVYVETCAKAHRAETGFWSVYN